MAAALPLIVAAQPASRDPITDRESYAVYDALLPSLWAAHSKDTMLLKEDTEFYQCRSKPKAPDADWQAAWDNYASENSRSRRLLYLFQALSPYSLVSTTDVKAEAARLAVQYPGSWERRPGQTDYATVSAVGFDDAKIRAVVYLSAFNSGEIVLAEKKDGHWRAATVPEATTCGWIA